MTFEYQIGWAASSNASFFSRSEEWVEWEGDEETAEAVEEALLAGQGSLSIGLEMAIDASGFEWWVKVREAGSADV